jgi:2-dehydropantoate 2-reductase
MTPGPILVAGAGAVGSVVGGLLARAGAAVTLLGRPAHVTAIRSHGLRIDGLFGDHHVPNLATAAGLDELRGPYAAILLTVKAYDSAAMAAAVAPLLAPDGVVISLQNGLGNVEAAARAVGRDRVLGGRVIFGAEVGAPGRVRVTVIADPVLIGSPDPTAARLQAAAETWAACLATAGIPAAPTRGLVAELWAKVLYSAALNPLGALLGAPYGALAAGPDTRAIMDAVIDEAFAVARADGAALAWNDAAGYRATFYGRLVPSTAGHRSSMLQDIERGRPTEIDAINGEVVARGGRRGLAVPTNTLLCRLIRARAGRPDAPEDACRQRSIA